MKKRVDLLLVEQGLCETRQKAQACIMAGIVYHKEEKIDKAGLKLEEDIQLLIKGKKMPYVSRGGLKLEKAIKNFKLDLNEKICMDIGASTGGFTDCMLQNGAIKVFSIDVGYGQFAWKLRQDERVVCLERTNIRNVTLETLNFQQADFASIDVSFISLKLVIPKLLELLKDTGECVALIKPQFEAGREKVGKKGVVRDAKVHQEVIEEITLFIKSIGLNILNLEFSPIKGPEGNIEYLVHFTKRKIQEEIDMEKIIREIVQNSHKNLE